LVEKKFNRSEAFEEEKQFSLTLSAELVVLPADFKEPRALYYDDTIRRGPIEIVSSSRLPSFKQKYGESTWPRAATVLTSASGSQLILSPIPDQSYSATLLYLTRLVPLSDANPSNWVLGEHTDLYLYGALLEASPYLKSKEDVPLWKSFYDEAKADLEKLVERRKWGATPLVIKPRNAIGSVLENQ
jgi:hypothetical protein